MFDLFSEAGIETSAPTTTPLATAHRTRTRTDGCNRPGHPDEWDTTVQREGTPWRYCSHCAAEAVSPAAEEAWERKEAALAARITRKRNLRNWAVL